MIVRDYVRNYQTNEEFVKVKEKNGNIKGIATIELFDAKTNDLIIEAKSHNIIYDFVYQNLRALQWKMFLYGLPNIDTEKLDFSYYGIGAQAVYMYLTNSPIEEAELDYDITTYDESIYIGEVIYDGGAEYSYTISESYVNDNRAHAVFNFDKNTANGTFNTILWLNDTNPDFFPDVVYRNVVPSDPNGYRIELVDDYLYVLNKAGILFKFTKDGTKIEEINNTNLVAGGTHPVGFASDGVFLYGLDYDGKFIKTDKNGIAVETPKYIGISTNAATGYGLCFDRGYLYAIDSSAMLYKISTSGILLEGPTNSGAHSGYYGVGIASDGAAFYMTDDEGTVIKVSKNGRIMGRFYFHISLLMAFDYDIPKNYAPYPIVFDGRNMYSIRNYHGCLDKYSRYYPLWTARTVLPRPITKTSNQTMRIVYDFIRV